MRNNYSEVNNQYILIAKPSKYFFVLASLVLIIWLFLGPLYWRNVDDYGPIEQFFENKISIFELVKYLPFWYWGSYPPIWHLWAFPSYIFKDINIDLTRYVLLAEGFISVILSSILMSSLCQKAILYTKDFDSKLNKNIRLISDILSISIIGLNPQIMIHSMTYMPYQLGLLSSILPLYFINSILFYQKNNIQEKYFLKVSKTKFSFFSFLSLLFIFQTFIIIVPSLVISVFLINKKKIIDLLKSLFYFLRINLFFTKYSFLIYLSIFVLIAFFRKLKILFLSNTGTGYWAYGIDEIFKLNTKDQNLVLYLKKVFFNSINIIGQSLYPYKENQLLMAYVFSSIIFFSLIFLFNKNKSFRFIFNFFLFEYIFAIICSTFTSINFSPTRHNIYLMPFAIFTIISLILIIYISKIEISKKLTKLLFTIIVMTAICLQMNFFIKSHNIIQYSKTNRIRMIEMAKKADFYLDLNHNRINNSPGVFLTHGEDEKNALLNKNCTKEKLQNLQKKSFTFFFFSHHNPIDFNQKEIKDYLIKNSRNCLNSNSKFTILEKIEKENRDGYEQSNFIYNIGANLYAYLVEVK